MKKIAAGLAVLLVLCGCQGNWEAQKAVKEILYNPDGAKFSDMHQGAAPGSVCGLVNAKNRLGAYVGKERFFYDGYVAGIASPVSDKDFHRLWLSLGRSFFNEDYKTTSAKCKLVAKWESVCGGTYPDQQPLCRIFEMDEPRDFIKALDEKFGTRY